MMRKNNNRGGNNKHRGGSNNGGGARRYGSNSSGGGNRGGANDAQNLQRQKHHATQQLGKYGDMARNAQINGDRVDVEYYLQHVDHYTRVLTDIAAIEAERFAHTRESQIIPGGPNDPNAAQYQQQEAQSDSADNAQANADAGMQQEAHADASAAPQQPYQPRLQRQRRPQHQHSADQASDNGAREANSNSEDIPLPGGIIPPI